MHGHVSFAKHRIGSKLLKQFIEAFPRGVLIRCDLAAKSSRSMDPRRIDDIREILATIAFSLICLQIIFINWDVCELTGNCESGNAASSYASIIPPFFPSPEISVHHFGKLPAVARQFLIQLFFFFFKRRRLAFDRRLVYCYFTPGGDI